MSPFYDNTNLKTAFSPLGRFGMKFAGETYSILLCALRLKQTSGF